MEQKIQVIINNEKKYTLQNNSSLEDIIKFIKEEYNLSKEQNIDLYDHDCSSIIKSFEDLKKLKDQTNRYNPYIKINFKVSSGITENKNKTIKTPLNGKINQEIPKNIYMKDIKNNSLKESSETSEVKNCLMEEISRNSIEKYDDDNIKEEAKRYKEKQEEEIQSLEKELDELKKINNELENENDNNIFLSNDLIINLKKDIINEIFLKIGEELKEKMKEIEKNINQEELIKKYEKYIDEQIEKKKGSILPEIRAPFGEITKKPKNIEDKINNAINIANNKVNKENQNHGKNQRQNNQNDKNVKIKNYMDNINTNLFNKGNNQNHIKNYKYRDQENVINNEEINLKKSNHKINQLNNIHLLNNLEKKEKPKIINADKFIGLNKNEPPLQKKNSNEIDLFDLLNNIFFKDKDQKIIKAEIINENIKNLIHRLYIKNLNEKSNAITLYIKTFIEYNVLPIFKQNIISGVILDIIKYNISEILEAIGMDKNYYSNYYFPQFKKGIKNRQRSVETVKRFRKEFNVDRNVINDEVLIEKLDENENDITKTFARMYEG